MQTRSIKPGLNRSSMRFTGIIFDFNGVLWWDQHLQEKSWNDFAQAFRGRTFSPQEFAIHVHGRNMAYTLAYLAGHALDQEQVGLLGEQKEAIYRQLCLAKGQDFLLSPGAGEKSLRSCTGINSLM